MLSFFTKKGEYNLKTLNKIAKECGCLGRFWRGQNRLLFFNSSVIDNLGGSDPQELYDYFKKMCVMYDDNKL